ncbi:MAG: hypothetical protein K6G75_07775 [Lachnospiraceae bacterium]|nr:hypothetical protein [Lachnospiraceae bacterium]
MFFFFDEETTETGPKVYRVKTLEDCKDAVDNIKRLKDEYDFTSKMKEDHEEELKSLMEAIKEQEKQLHEFSIKYDYNSQRLRDNIELLLKKNNIQTNTLEAILEFSAGYISRTLGKDAKKKLSIDAACKIANLFEVNVDDMLNSDLTEPSKDLKKVLKFLDTLKEDVDMDRSHWKKIDPKPSSETSLFYREVDGKTVYMPSKISSILKEIEDIRVLDTKIGKLYLVRGLGIIEDVQYELYQFDEENYKSNIGTEYENKFPLNIMIDTFTEETGLLNKYCEKLYKTIKTHESDFELDSNTRHLIDKFMGTFEGGRLF